MIISNFKYHFIKLKVTIILLAISIIILIFGSRFQTIISICIALNQIVT
jgi:hypothetical protein